MQFGNNNKFTTLFTRRFLLVLAVVVLTSGILVACGGSSTESETEAAEAAPAAQEEAAESSDSEEAEPVTETVTETTAAETSAAEEEAPAEDATAEDATAEETSGTITFSIVPEESEVRFYIDEVLLGNDKTVIGTTSLSGGAFSVDPTAPSTASIEVIEVEASGLTTDDDRRNRTINERVLLTSEYPTITFAPTELSGLPETVTVGEPFAFQVTGDLTILDTTESVTFDMEIMPVSETEIQGLGTATILYADYGISIPSVPAVASVEDDVKLEIEFTAIAAE